MEKKWVLERHEPYESVDYILEDVTTEEVIAFIKKTRLDEHKDYSDYTIRLAENYLPKEFLAKFA